MKEFVDRLEIAQNHFDWASSPVEVDIAIYELAAAELAISNYVDKEKNGGFRNGDQERANLVHIV